LGSLLKALGLTIWGVTALGLVAIFIFVGYQAALKYRAANAPIDAAPVAAQPLEPASPPPVRSDPATPAAARKDGNSAAAAEPPPPQITPPLFQNAAALNHHDLVIEFGQQLMDNGMATADDMVSIARSYSSIEDCANARAAMEKALSAFRAAGREPSETQRQVTLNCHDKPRVMIDPAHTERVNSLLLSLRARAAADRAAMPRLEAQAAAAQSGNPSVILGELLYGFGEYGKAVQAIRRGLDKGGVTHLDDAYVYLGRAEQSQGEFDEARKAFARLKDVPGISPHVLTLWTLYAEVELSEGAPR
jgi:tetratricopeptide (TPR) repeat protein